MTQPNEPTILYWVVPCPDCRAAPLTPCLDGGKPVPDDVHLGRYELFASARFHEKKMRLDALMALLPSEYHPD